MRVRMKLMEYRARPLGSIDDEILDFVDYWRFQEGGDLDRQMYAFSTCVSDLLSYSDEQVDEIWARFILEREP